jgi:hypothetical protein
VLGDRFGGLIETMKPGMGSGLALPFDRRLVLVYPDDLKVWAFKAGCTRTESAGFPVGGRVCRSGLGSASMKVRLDPFRPPRGAGLGGFCR